MAKAINIKVSPKLLDACNVVGKSFAEDIKKRHGLTELFVPNTLATELIAGQILGSRSWKYKVRKTSLTTGILELIY